MYKVDNAIIMAAGVSSRFAPLSFETPKALTEVKGEILIERFKEWRAYKRKIKCLCKHKYKLDWLSGNGIAKLKCSNCGKKKQMIIDTKSFEVFLG